MTDMKELFRKIITCRLDEAPVGPAKGELIEELAENLTCRWADLVAGGMDEGEAQTLAIEALGDTDELVEYLKSLEPDQPLPDPVEEGSSALEELLGNVEDLIRGAVKKARTVIRDARETVKGNLRSDDSAAGPDPEASPEAEPAETGEEPTGAEPAEGGETAAEEPKGGWNFSMGYDSHKGKFYAGKDRDHGIEVGADDIKTGIKDLMKNIETLVRDAADAAQNAAGKAAETVRKAADTAADAKLGDPVPAGDPIEGDALRGISVETTGGNVTVRMTQPADGDVVIEGSPEELEGLEVFRTDDGVLTIRPVRTETFAFFSRRGMWGSSVDVTLDLPCRDWDFLELRTTGGDIRVTADRPVGQMTVQTVSGDVTGEVGICPRVLCRTTGGDIRWTGDTAEFRGETVSGDIRFSGRADSFRTKTTSGDTELEGAVDSLSVRSVSGDVWVRSALLPGQLSVGTVSGDVKADLPDGEPFTVSFSSTGGTFRSDFFTGAMGGRSCRFTYQGGGTRIYNISTVSGDLELRRLAE